MVANIESLIQMLVGYHVNCSVIALVTVSIIAIFFDIIPVLIAAVLSALIVGFLFYSL